MTERDFWKLVYAVAIMSGASNDEARDKANLALQDYEDYFG